MFKLLTTKFTTRIRYCSKSLTKQILVPPNIVSSCRFLSTSNVKFKGKDSDDKSEFDLMKCPTEPLTLKPCGLKRKDKLKRDEAFCKATKNRQIICPPPPTPVKSDTPDGKEGALGPDGSKDGGGKTPGSAGQDGSGDDTSAFDLRTKLLLALLLAGAGGGLLYFLSKSSSKSSKPCEEEEEESPCDTVVVKKIPASSKEIPNHVPYLLIGGGTASFSAFRAIKSHDPKAKVMVISTEMHKPYMRPPLSKELWYHAERDKKPDDDFRFKQWNGASRSLFYEPEQFYVDPTQLMEMANGGVAVCHGYRVKKILPFEQKAILSDGTAIRYDKCLIATGCTPKNLDIVASAPQKVKDKVSVYRNPEDFIKLKKIADCADSITIVGSGFLGSELACALTKYGRDRQLKVYQVFYEKGNMGKVLPSYLSDWTTRNVENQGVRVVPSVQIVEVERIHEKIKLKLNNGNVILTDHVVLCTGCEANVDIAKASGLEIDRKHGGFLVNAELEARKNLFVAGDAACFYDPLLGRRRVEHHDHSVVSGRLAGENMTGLKRPYKHQSMFWSDLGPELGYEGIGLIDSSLPTVGVFAKMEPEKVQGIRGTPPHENILKEADNISKSDVKEADVKATSNELVSEPSEEDDFGRGVIFYLKDNKVVGILLWNIFNRIGLARQIINENKAYEDLNEVAKLFEIHS